MPDIGPQALVVKGYSGQRQSWGDRLLWPGQGGLHEASAASESPVGGAAGLGGLLRQGGGKFHA